MKRILLVFGGIVLGVVLGMFFTLLAFRVFAFFTQASLGEAGLVAIFWSVPAGILGGLLLPAFLCLKRKYLGKERRKKIINGRFITLVFLFFLLTFIGSLKLSSLDDRQNVSFFGQNGRKVKGSGEEDSFGFRKKEEKILGVEREEGEKEWLGEGMKIETDTGDFDQKGREAIERLAKILGDNDPLSLYDLFGEDLRDAFSLEEVKEKVGEGLKIVQVEILSGPKVSGPWMEAVFRLKLEEGRKEKHLAVFHLEGGEWKLFATEEIR